VDDEDLKVICGTDSALYLVFLRLCALFFGIVTTLNGLILIPLYLTGDADSDIFNEDEISLLERITLINISARFEKVAFSFVFIFLYAGLAFYMLALYNFKSRKWSVHTHSHVSTLLLISAT